MEKLNQLSEQHRIIIHKLLEGETLAAIGRRFGISSNAIHQKSHYAARILRGHAAARLRKKHKEASSSPLICSVFELGQPLINQYPHLSVTFYFFWKNAMCNYSILHLSTTILNICIYWKDAQSFLNILIKRK